jgi:hypothetical protein
MVSGIAGRRSIDVACCNLSNNGEVPDSEYATAGIAVSTAATPMLKIRRGLVENSIGNLV